MNPLICRTCGKDNSAHTAAGAIPCVPHDGDVSLCLYCATWSVFEDGALRQPTPYEQAWIITNPDCMRAARVAAMVTTPGGRS